MSGWTYELHPSSWDPRISAWHCIAPADDPQQVHPTAVAFDHALPDGRRAYPYTGSHAARQAAERANQ